MKRFDNDEDMDIEYIRPPPADKMTKPKTFYLYREDRFGKCYETNTVDDEFIKANNRPSHMPYNGFVPLEAPHLPDIDYDGLNENTERESSEAMYDQM